MYGSPGTGKSSEVFAFAMNRATRGGLRVLYVHSSRTHHSIISKSGSDATKHVDDVVPADYWVFTAIGEKQIDLATFIDQLMRKNKYGLVVVDAVAQDLCMHVNAQADLGTAIICTSYQSIDISTRSEESHPANHILVPSWTEVELQAAANRGAIGPFSDEEHRLRYYMGGASIRLYLTATKKAKKFIDHCVNRVDDIAAIIKGRVGPSSPGAINTLLANFSSGTSVRSILVSQYAVKRVAEHTKPELIAFCRASLKHNPVWQGWVTEMEVMHLLSKGPLTLWHAHEQTEEWHGGGQCEYFSDHTEVSLYEEYSPGAWLFPHRWNEALFDCIQIVGDENKTVRVVQITNAVQHSFFLSYLNEYLESLGAYRVDFVFVCQSQNFPGFVLPKVRLGTRRSAVSAEHELEYSGYGELLRRGQDFVVEAHQQMRITVRKVSYQELPVSQLAKRNNPYTFLDPSLKMPKPDDI